MQNFSLLFHRDRDADADEADITSPFTVFRTAFGMNTREKDTLFSWIYLICVLTVPASNKKYIVKHLNVVIE